jgi:hypothetical protein
MLVKDKQPKLMVAIHPGNKGTHPGFHFFFLTFLYIFSKNLVTSRYSRAVQQSATNVMRKFLFLL